MLINTSLPIGTIGSVKLNLLMFKIFPLWQGVDRLPKGFAKLLG